MEKILSKPKVWVPVVILAGMLVILMIIQLINSCYAVNALLKKEGLNYQVENSAGWNEYETRNLKKDIFWYEQLLILSQADSIYLAFDLQDSLVQIGIKGFNMVQTKILHLHPSDFLKDLNEDSYRHFTTINPIVEETACIPKKAVKKVIAYSDNEEHHDADKLPVYDIPLSWSFTTGSNLRVVITGVKRMADSSFSLQPTQDFVKYRFLEFIKQPVSKHYNPTIYLWLCDQDAKAIFRAVPPGGKVLFRN